MRTVSSSGPIAATPVRFLLGVLLCSVHAEAQVQAPEQALQEALAAARQAGTLSAMENFVDWDYLFDNMPTSARRSLGVNSSAELRAYHREFYSDPSRRIESRFKTNAARFSDAELNGLIKDAVAQTTKANRRLAEAEFEIGAARITGPSAKVAYSARSGGVRTTGEATMVQRGERWLLGEFPLRVDLGSEAPAGAGGAPGVVFSD